ncbi:MAG: GDP-mannose 4,6-dehydratase [Chitinophagales bacterium]|nr:GDP-mannose 4,6-dehydratase [Chitinophagales bacterium]
MRSILVTGCAGFIGSHLTEFLLKKYPEDTIFGVDNFDDFYSKDLKEKNLLKSISHSNFKFYELDLRDTSSYSKLPNCEVIVHLAAKAGVRPSIQNPLAYIDYNITATQQLLEWMKDNQMSKLVFASSSSIYGNNKKVPFSETDNVDHPISPYAFTKKACELLTHTYYHLYGFSVINLRFFTVFGPRQRPDLAINKFVSSIMANEEIEMYGDGSTARDYTYIADIVEGISNAIDYVQNHNCYETINLGNSNPIRLTTLIETIEMELKKKAKILARPMQEGDVDITFADIDRAKNLLSYQPKISIKEGIRQFIEWKKVN